MKKVVAQLPPHANLQTSIAERYAWELEALEGLAEITEVQARNAREFIDGGARDADAVVTSWGIRIDREVIAGLERCVVIAVGSVGVDMVDVEAATEAGIVVTNTPDIFIDEVADHALALLLGTARRTKLMDELIRAGDWFKGRPVLEQNPRLFGQTLGLIAYGNVASAVAHRARAFGMRVIAHDPYVSELKMTRDGVEPVSWNELLERSDFVSMHAPLNQETHHMLGASDFERMKPSAAVINTGRGPTIDEAALIEALQQGQIAAAGLDVLEQEPPDLSNPLLSMANVIVTPHAASATDRMRPETRRRVGREVALALRGRWPMCAVNPTVLPRVTLERWQPYPMERGPNR